MGNPLKKTMVYLGLADEEEVYDEEPQAPARAHRDREREREEEAGEDLAAVAEGDDEELAQRELAPRVGVDADDVGQVGAHLVTFVLGLRL